MRRWNDFHILTQQVNNDSNESLITRENMWNPHCHVCTAPLLHCSLNNMEWINKFQPLTLHFPSVSILSSQAELAKHDTVILPLWLYPLLLDNNSGKETSSLSRSGHQQHWIITSLKKRKFLLSGTAWSSCLLLSL